MRWLLIVLNLLNAASCALGWFYLVVAGAPGMSVAESLRPGTFDSFVVPGWILLVVVGGMHLVAAIMLLRRRPSAAFWSAASGTTMVIWIYVEVVLMTGTHLFHHIWGALGLLELGGTLILLGLLDRRAAEAVGARAAVGARQGAGE